MIASVSFALVLSAAAALASPHDSRSHHDLIAKRREGDNNITKRDSFTNKEFTWYGTGTGADACTGKDHSDDDYYVAMGYDQYGSGGCCGKRMQLNYKSKSIIVECVDECASCPQWGQLDLTKGVFEYLIGDLGIGEVSASWSYVSDTAKLGPVTGDSGSDDTTTKKSSSSTKKATSTKEAAPTTSSTKHTTQTPTTTHISTPAETPKTSKSTTADAPANTSSDNDDEDDGEDCEEEDDEDSGDDGEECEADDGDDEDDGEECEADDGDAEDEPATTTTHKAVVVATSTHTPTSTKEKPVTSSSTKEKPVTSSSDVEEEEPYTSVTSTKIATSSAKASSSAKPSSTVTSSTAVVANVADTPSTTSTADDSTESSDDSTAPITGALSGAASNGVNPLFVAAAAIVLAAVAL